MKRFIVIALAVLLLLPVLLVPCLAAPASIVVDGTVVDSAMCVFDVSALPAGEYLLVLSSPLVGEIAYTPDPVFFSGVDSDLSFNACSDSLGECLVLTGYIISGELYIGNVLSLPAGMPLTLTLTLDSDSSLFTDFSSVASAVIDWVSLIVAAILENPLLLFTVGIFFVGGCIALFGRLLSRN